MKSSITILRVNYFIASINGHQYSGLGGMVIGPVPSSGSSPGLPLTLDNNSCTPTPNPPTTPGDIDDGASPNHQSSGSINTANNNNNNSNNNNSSVHNNNLNNHSAHNAHQHHPMEHQEQPHHQHHHHHSTADSPNDQSSLIVLQPTGVGVTSEIGVCTPAGIGGYSPMLPSFSHYAPGKFIAANKHNMTRTFIIALSLSLSYLIFYE